jgi:hypothetical protein
MLTRTAARNMQGIDAHLNKCPRSLGSAVLACFFRMRVLGWTVDLCSSRLLGSADSLWHDFILDTRAYSKFCAEFPGGFLHHTPRTGSAASVEATESRFIAAYESVHFAQYREPEIDRYIATKTAPAQPIRYFHECG